jgi:hypothetical protein
MSTCGSVIHIRSHGAEDNALPAQPLDALGPGRADSAVYSALAEPGEVVDSCEVGIEGDERNASRLHAGPDGLNSDF